MATETRNNAADITDEQFNEIVGAPVVAVRRRTIDLVLVALGAVVTVVMVVAGGLLTWGANFADDYVADELGSQQIFFPEAESLEAEGRTDLVQYAGEQVTTGEHAEAYASYIDGHLQGIADGMTYAELGGPQRAAAGAVTEAVESGASDEEVAELQATADQLSGQRDSLFRGETLRGLLLSAYAWSTVGQIAGIAAIVAFVGAAVMAVLTVAGVFHYRKAAKA
ncbi:MAG: hypothetical protein S0880_27600 [Actinomycetota bacterium]|nr:hypothetical protein [Actinomycetota bacterium]